MKKKEIAIVTAYVMLLLCNAKLHAQYTDHRNRQVDSLEQLLQTNPPKGTELVRIYRSLTYGYQQINIDKSMEYARKAIAGIDENEHFNALLNMYEALGVGYYKKSRYDSAYFYYDKALDIARRMKKHAKYAEKTIDDNVSGLYGQMGNLYNIQGLYHEAIDYYTRALEIFTKYGWKESMAIAYINIGELYKSMDNYEQAKAYFLKLDAIAHEANDSLLIAEAGQGLSSIALHEGNYDEALRRARVAYQYYFAHPEEGEEKVVTLNLLAEIFLIGYHDLEKAEAYCRQAVETVDTLHLPREKAMSLSLLATIHLHRDRWREAEHTALEALATDDTEPANTMNLYQILSKAYAHLGDAAKSTEYLDKHYALQASWSNKHYQSSLREMEVKYESEKKETRIATLEEEKRLILWLSIASAALLLLGLTAFFFLWRWTLQKHRLADKQTQLAKQHVKLAEQQTQLAEQEVKQLKQEKQLIATQALLDGEMQERTRLARDLHDGLGSMLTGTKMNLEELRDEVLQGTVDIERFNNAVKILNDSSRELRRVAHHLMPDSLSRFGLKTSVSDFCNVLSIVSFSWYGDETRLEPKLETMIYRTIHELVNNALKHANASQILVQIIQESDRIAFTVEDNGCGFNPSAVTKGMGLANIRTRVASSNGMIHIASKPGEGTEIHVELKIKNGNKK